jgi:hypothetical protein
MINILGRTLFDTTFYYDFLPIIPASLKSLMDFNIDGYNNNIGEPGAPVKAHIIIYLI